MLLSLIYKCELVFIRGWNMLVFNNVIYKGKLVIVCYIVYLSINCVCVCVEGFVSWLIIEYLVM